MTKALEVDVSGDYDEEGYVAVDGSTKRRRRHHRHTCFFATSDDYAPIEVTGLTLCSIARGAAAMSTIFLGPALLRLAEDAATEVNDSGRIYGMRPTSLLTNISVFGGLLAAFHSPLFGSIVDHTPYRWDVGFYSAMVLSFIKGIEAFVSPSTWAIVSALQVVNIVVYNAYLVATYAYTAELSRQPNDQTMYNSHFQMIYYISMLLFLISVMSTSTIIGANDVVTARISQTLAFLACTSIFFMSWRWYFRPRLALNDIPVGKTLARSGYDKLFLTLSQIRNHDDQCAVKYFLLSVSLSEAATSALVTISTTYMSHELEMDASQIGGVFLCVFVAGIPGSKFGGFIGTRINPLRSALLCLAIFIVNTTAAACVLRDPKDGKAMYAFAAVWGVCLAWLHPTHASLFCTIIPTGQEGELMGIYIFAGSVLAWLPPFLFSFLNEIGASMTIGLVSLNVFFTGAFVFLLFIGEYDSVVDIAAARQHVVDGVWTPPSSPDGDDVVVRNIPELT